jgi:hypothetical protein
MRKLQTIENITEEISGKLLDSIRLLEIFYELNDGEGKTDTLLRIIIAKIKYAFFKIEKCRKFIS